MAWSVPPAARPPGWPGVESAAPIRVAMLGLGTVGSGVVALLARNREDIERKVGRPLDVVRVLVRDPTRARAAPVPADRLTADVDAVLEDPDVDIVVEVMGGTALARQCILRALRAGKAVVTANKDVMAESGAEVWAAADAGGADVFFEASVGGGIPIVRALQHSLAGNSVRRLVGILNGTTNYILTRMTRDGLDADAALAQAQAHGYAEADPAADLDGLDAARKLCILSALAYSVRCQPADVATQGIREISAADVTHAARMGCTIKLLAISERHGDAVGLRVHPAFLPRSHPLAAVHDAFNAVYVQGDAVGEAMFYGRGAGALPTASSVVGDLMEAARFLCRGIRGTTSPHLLRLAIAPIDAVESRFYVRLRVPDRVGVLARIAGVFGEAEVSILRVEQSPLDDDGPVPQAPEHAELILVTHRVREDRMERAVAGLRRCDVVAGIGSVIRLAPEDL